MTASSPVSSLTSRTAVCSRDSPGSGVPFGNPQTPSESRPQMTNSTPLPDLRKTTPPAETARSTGAPLQVGHNRRFARLLGTLRDALPRGRKIIEYRVAVAPIPGDHWSRREATTPDVLVGLVGRYYGKVPRGQDRSLTEMEFDVAGQVGIRRDARKVERGERSG